MINLSNKLHTVFKFTTTGLLISILLISLLVFSALHKCSPLSNLCCVVRTNVAALGSELNKTGLPNCRCSQIVDWCRTWWMVCWDYFSSSTLQIFCIHLPYIHLLSHSLSKSVNLVWKLVEWARCPKPWHWDDCEFIVRYITFCT